MSKENEIELPKVLKATDEKLQQNYVSLKTQVTKNALHALQVRIPEKMQKYEDLIPMSSNSSSILDNSDFPHDDPIYSVLTDTITEESAESEPKRFKTDDYQYIDGVVKLPKYIYSFKFDSSNKICDRISHIKQEATEMMDIVSNIKLWIQLNIPKIEDGNNFGVAIQEDVIHELNRVEEAAFTLRDNTSKFYLQRAKLLTKILKYPKVEDYRRALKELDEKQWFQMKVNDLDTRNNYIIIYDMLYKNWNKVVRPRTSDRSVMVY